MSNFYHLKYCSKCEQMTNHLYLDDTPRRHLYTAECCKCGYRPIQAEPDYAVMQALDEEAKIEAAEHHTSEVDLGEDGDDE